ncbi:trypsin-like serine protease [Nonomuraea sp. SMC257]|uniref:Trypsin-like serine protease n=1 Tax=Nonomuraea montanisoli TaxID=2741721 RepID=A0A7Y6M5Y0_9ACTN|nr:trypsin-like serine protease [Nonomuraea montanisoli]NUW35101.1 trypsin-like serine protease [Nonomuraea montanisoli]
MIPPVRRLAAVALSALLALPALGGTASAGAESWIYSVTLAKTAADVQKVAATWKPDVLKHADSYSPATPGSQSSTSAGATAVPSSEQITPAKKVKVPLSVSPELPEKGTTARTMGKVYFRFGAKEYWCSASAVAAKNRSVVATAAHCAYDARQAKPADSWIFVPNPGPNGETPDGIYVGAEISMHEHWPGRGDYDYDYAFVTVHRGFTWATVSGKLVMKDVGRLQDNVGGQGLAVAKGVGNSVTTFGYPAGPQPDGTRPFDGRKLLSCTGSTRWTVAPSRDLQYGVQIEPCNFTAGASGGPWLIDYQPAQGLGSLNGINSLTWNRDAKGGYDAMSTPNFTLATGEVYRHAAAVTTPANVT